MKKIIFAACAALSVSTVSADVNPHAGRGAAGGLVLLPTARAGAMGNAFAAAADNADALLGSPAGLARLSRVELTASHKPLVADIIQQQASLIIPLGGLATAENVRTWGAIGVGMATVDYGDFAGRNAVNGAAPNFTAEDQALALGYGRWVTSQLAVGASVKSIRTRIAEKHDDYFTYDVGLLFSPRPKLWRAAVSAVNLGGRYDFDGATQETEDAWVAGFALMPDKSVTFLLDAVDGKDSRLGMRGGVEWWAGSIVALRAGYDQTRDIESGFTAGAGLRIREFEMFFFPLQDVLIDYSFAPAASDFEEAGSHNVSLTLRFGGD